MTGTTCSVPLSQVQSCKELQKPAATFSVVSSKGLQQTLLPELNHYSSRFDWLHS